MEIALENNLSEDIHILKQLILSGKNMAKMEIELTEEQLEKVKQLEANDISVGEAIDLLFEAKEKTLNLIEEIESSENDDSTLDVTDKKAKELNKNYGDSPETYEMGVKKFKQNISWTDDVFKF